MILSSLINMHQDITKIESKKYLKLIQLSIINGQQHEKQLQNDKDYLDSLNLTQFDNLDKKSIIDSLTINELQTFKKILLDFYLLSSIKAISFQTDYKYCDKLIQQSKKK